MGTGFERIKEICKRENSPFLKIEFNEHYFYVTFKQSREYLKLSKAKPTVEKILELIITNPEITQKELMQKTVLTRRGVE